VLDVQGGIFGQADGLSDYVLQTVIQGQTERRFGLAVRTLNPEGRLGPYGFHGDRRPIRECGRFVENDSTVLDVAG
jgi:hypothetical protein